MAVFAEKLVPFGEALADYSEAVEGKVKQDAVESSINAGKALAGLASEIPKSGGVLGWFLGENGIDDFGTKMVAFGKSIVEYSKAVSGNVDSDVIDASVNAGKALAGLAAEVPNDGGIISWFTGDKSFGKFGKNLESFGLAMSAYYNAIKDIVGTPIYMAVSAARSVVSLAKDIAGVDTDKMSALGRALNMFGQSGIGEFAKAFVDSGDDMKGAASSLVGNLTTAMGEKRGALTSASKNAADTVVSALRGQYGAFHSAGLYVTEGFAKGISANTFLAKAKAVQMANDTKAAAERTLQINSPSKVFEEIGAYVAKGFGLGISKNTKQAAKSAENLARVGEAAAWVVADSLNRGSKTFDEFVEKTDKDGNAVELTLERAADAFRKFRNSVKQNIREAISVFDEWEEDSEVTGKKMMENLEYQILGLQEWAGNIRRLARRGMDEGFLKVLSDLGPSGAKYASALMKMSDKSLKKMNTLYRKRMSLDGKAASEIASSFLVAGQKAAAAFGKGLGNQNGAAAAVENLAAKQKSLAQKLGKDASKNMGKAAKYLSFGDAVESIKSGLAYGKGAFQKFVGAYLTAVKNVTVGSKAVKAASKALTAYGQKLYEQSDYYKEDSANIKEHKKELSALQKQRNKIQKQLKKANKSNTVASRKRAKELKEELSEANKSIKSAKKQIKQDQKDVAAHTKEVFNELRSGLAESVSSFIDPLKASLDTGIELFERFAEETRKVSTTKLLRNMKSQVDGISAWRESLKKLEKKGLADGLLQKLKEMGPDGAKYVDAFLRMTAEELKQANETFARSENLTSETFLGNFTDSLDAAGKWADAMQKLTKMGISQGLLEQLGDMGPDGMDYVNAFLNMIPEQVEELNKKYAKSLKLPESAADKVISSFVYAGGEGVKGFTAALEKLAKTGTKENKALMDAVNKVGNGIQSGLDTIAKKTKKKAKKAGVEAGKKALEGLAEGLNMKKADSSIGVLQTNLKKTVAKVTQGLFDINVDGNPFLKVVDNVSAGLVTSIKANTQSVASAAAGMALGVYEAAKGALEIHSPSKKFQEIGEYADMGFSQGIASGVDGVCATAVSAMGRVIDIISDAVDGGMDIRPTICPVLDLTEVQNGAGRISGILDGVSLSGSDGLAQMAAKGMSKLNARTDDSPVWDAINDLKETLKGLSGTQGDTYNNTFHIQGSSPKEIADEVSHIIQQQVERRRAAWG